MPGDELVAAGVVEGSLDPAVDPADGQAIRLIEVGDGVVVLELAVLDDHIGCGPIAIDGQSGAPAALPGVAEEPFKAVLSSTGLGQRFVAQVQDVELVAGVPSHVNDSNELGEASGSADMRADPAGRRMARLRQRTRSLCARVTMAMTAPAVVVGDTSPMAPDPDLEPQSVAVRGPGGDAEWTLAPARPHAEWSMELVGPDRKFTGYGTNCFGALRDLRQQLDEQGLLIGVNGARPNCTASGMLADMGDGRSVYALDLGA